jgi:hypothetical protein
MDCKETEYKGVDWIHLGLDMAQAKLFRCLLIISLAKGFCSMQ